MQHGITSHMRGMEDQWQGRNLIISILFEEGVHNQFLDSIHFDDLPPLPHSKAELEYRDIHGQVTLFF